MNEHITGVGIIIPYGNRITFRNGDVLFLCAYSGKLDEWISVSNLTRLHRNDFLNWCGNRWSQIANELEKDGLFGTEERCIDQSFSIPYMEEQYIEWPPFLINAGQLCLGGKTDSEIKAAILSIIDPGA